MILEEKLKRAIFQHGDYFVMEMPADEEFLRAEGIAMGHCLQSDFNQYVARMRLGRQRQFSLVDSRTGEPQVNIELSLTHSSYAGRVRYPVITQIRGHRNQCPPADKFLPAVVTFLEENRLCYAGHGVPNFDGLCDGDRVRARWLELERE